MAGTVRTPVLDLFRPALHRACRAFFGLELVGVQQIPRDGAVIITPNHQTYADPPLVTIPIRRPVYYMAWSRLFRVPALGFLLRRLRAFPVDIDAADVRATRHVVRLLTAGEAVMIFPEGERSRDGRLGRFKPGAFRLATSLGVPILPVTIAGGHDSWPPGRVLPRPGRIAITYHPLEHPDRGRDPRDAARQLAERVRDVIQEALPPDARAD
ncbi:MAG: 1-acyl-sn-glycerol-3-phosphate acyltransferase [Candidatus Rokubacteria bacterium]|nr:1-acyl-sn-glycerol-3-phosphate acyltransferase [Candidatus Rokubacteria bacterium]